MRRLPSTPVAALLVASCAAAPLPPSQSPVVTAAPALAPAPAAASSPGEGEPLVVDAPVASALPPAVALDAPLACAFDTPQWHNVARLSLQPAGPAFVRVLGGAAHLSIPTGPAGDTLLQVSEQGISVQGHLPAPSTTLRARQPFVLNDFAIPTVFARLSWVQGDDGSLLVEVEPPAGLTLLGAPLRASRPCSDIGLDSGSFQADAAVPGGGDSHVLDVRLLTSDVSCDLQTAVQASPVARLKVAEPTLVQVFERRAGMSRVSLPFDSLVVFGWVKSSVLKPAGSLAGFGSGHGRLGVRTPEHKVIETLRCDHSTPLLAEVGDARRTVGTIEASRPIEVTSRDREVAQIWVWTENIHAEPGAHLLVRAEDVADCVVEPRQ